MGRWRAGPARDRRAGGPSPVESKKPGTKGLQPKTLELKAGETKPIWVQMQAEASQRHADRRRRCF